MFGSKSLQLLPAKESKEIAKEVKEKRFLLLRSNFNYLISKAAKHGNKNVSLQITNDEHFKELTTWFESYGYEVEIQYTKTCAGHWFTVSWRNPK